MPAITCLSRELGTTGERQCIIISGRLELFVCATKDAGKQADFDNFRISDRLTDSIGR